MADDVDSASSGVPAVRTPEQEAARIAEAFDFYDRGEHWEVAGGRRAEDSLYGTARVCRVVPGRVLHVVGASAMAEQLRHLYGCGAVTGWTLQPMPETRTLLHTVQQAIREASGGTGRGYTQLSRGGFVHTEEVQACPDTAMLGVNNIGPGTLEIIRAVLPYTGPDPAEAAAEPADAGDGGMAAVPHAGATGLFSTATRARYPRLVEQLAASRMPEAALTRIAEALNGEPLPPADPMVDLLLDTAGLRRALEIYRATHDPAP
ncbi:hypothetical protein [Amycolatopsis australiensis]|uniref:Uncharacterized protein n=1 Tax=Amycolatopsis australiensis TaxID=546364 RepID=A0A1K1LM01_9PSEU|nr:hypothetical protein [Amycolatopsis australiensis]SFW11916.1 hypothetical protein SAMN04489730_0070 [Amycolatopsis australiensis]